MKKWFLSLGLIAIFGWYLFLRQSGISSAQTVTQPQNNDLPAPSNTSLPPTTDISNTPPITKTPNPTGLRDGTYTGSRADALYGIVQVSAAISGGKLTDVKFLSYPNDRDNSRAISQYAMPILKSEAIRVQNASVDIVSGATLTSEAFRESLSSALAKAGA